MKGITKRVLYLWERGKVAAGKERKTALEGVGILSKCLKRSKHSTGLWRRMQIQIRFAKKLKKKIMSETYFCVASALSLFLSRFFKVFCKNVVNLLITKFVQKKYIYMFKIYNIEMVPKSSIKIWLLGGLRLDTTTKTTSNREHGGWRSRLTSAEKSHFDRNREWSKV